VGAPCPLTQGGKLRHRGNLRGTRTSGSLFPSQAIDMPAWLRVRRASAAAIEGRIGSAVNCLALIRTAIGVDGRSCSKALPSSVLAQWPCPCRCSRLAVVWWRISLSATRSTNPIALADQRLSPQPTLRRAETFASARQECLAIAGNNKARLIGASRRQAEAGQVLIISRCRPTLSLNSVDDFDGLLPTGSRGRQMLVPRAYCEGSLRYGSGVSWELVRPANAANTKVS
jgi:hypothetical protein